MTGSEQREAARQFINRWRGKGKEDEDGRSYWIELLSNVFGVENVTERIDFEKKVVVDGNTKRIDVYIPETRVIIEQKSLNVPLNKKIRNSGDIDLTPFEQADRYNSKLIFDERARWIVTCNFAEIWIYDMNEKQPEPTKIMLEELQTKYPLLDFLVEKEVQKISHEMEVSIQAGDIVGLIYNAFLEQYKIPEEKKNETAVEKAKREHKLKSLNALCVRLVFCLYAEDAGIFGEKRNMFHDYLARYEARDCRRALIELFKVLDTEDDDREDYLEEEFNTLQAYKTLDIKRKHLMDFQEKLAHLKFLDPACGSGNFLTETYLSLRRLENKVLRVLYGEGQGVLGIAASDIIKVSIQQFYGIEINDFAVTVAKTALWIAESQMLDETKNIIYGLNADFLPLKTYVNITEGNALRMDWNSVIPANSLSYIMGNPPFLGYALQSQSQKDDIKYIASNIDCKIGSNVDYVAMWYFKASEYIKNTEIKCAFVSTNSITQGEQVAVIWKPLFEKYDIAIDFAYQTFRWDSEANIKAHVHCVIIGFCHTGNSVKKILYSQTGEKKEAQNINPYLVDAPSVFIERRTKPICDVPSIYRGSQPTDNGNLILSKEEMEDLICKEPLSQKFIRPFMMGRDFINREYRYCLWLENANPSEIKKCPSVMERIENVREFRLKSKKAATRKKAEVPFLFDENHACKTDYIAIPVVSSQNRRYIPMELLHKDVIAGNKLFMMPEGSLYYFGILTSNVHMAWMRTVTGRLKSDYSYSNTIVYNNFPWPLSTNQQRLKIEQTAQSILDARSLYPDNSLADLYNPVLMPLELRKAHIANDKAVMAAYGFSLKMSEEDCVAELMKLYQKKLQEEKKMKSDKKSKTK